MSTKAKRILTYIAFLIVLIMGFIYGLNGIYRDIRAHRAGKVPSSNWAALFEEFQKEGGQTGYRDQYANAEARAESIKSELKQFSEGKAKQLTRGVFGWLSDYNETMENAVRLAAYKVAKEKGISNQQAASIAKNITVNFNRKGQMATQVGALYAFFNASVQGTTRIAETLFEPNNGDLKSIRLSKVGKRIITGGQSQKFYNGIRQLNMLESEYKGLLKAGRRQEATEFMAENPGVRLIMMGNYTESQVRKLRTQKRELVKNDADTASIKAIDGRITETMRKFNERVAAVM